MKEIRLSNDVLIPAIGFGTYRTPDSSEGVAAICEAIKSGYRLIDGAAKYENEKMVGTALAESGVARQALFVTSKVWPTDMGYDATMRAFERSLTDLGLDYLDMYLIHWPASPTHHDDWKEINASTWKALENLLDLNCVRSIGVSNFKPSHLEPLLASANIPPMVNQIECNPGMRQQATREWCAERDIVVEAWSPLGRGRIFENPLLLSLARKYGKTVAQIALRWEVQSDIIPIPKSVNPDRIRQNIDIFDFHISDEDMEAINSLPIFGESGLDPDAVDFG